MSALTVPIDELNRQIRTQVNRAAASKRWGGGTSDPALLSEANTLRLIKAARQIIADGPKLSPGQLARIYAALCACGEGTGNEDGNAATG